MRKILFAAMMVVAGLGATMPKAYAIGEFSSGNWRGYVETDNNGRFRWCRMSVGYSNNYRVTFAITGNGRMLFALANTTWNLNVGNKPEMRVQIDGNTPMIREGSITDRITVSMFLTDSDNVFNQVRYGQNIRVTVGTASESFTLQGTYNALQALLACAYKYR